MNSYATIIPRGRKVHQYYKDHNQTWNPYEQIAHIHAEVSELWEDIEEQRHEYLVGLLYTLKFMIDYPETEQTV